MRYFPVFLDLRGRACLVVGDTAEARHKAEILRGTGAVVDCCLQLGSIERPYVLAVISTGEAAGDAAAARVLSAL